MLTTSLTFPGLLNPKSSFERSVNSNLYFLVHHQDHPESKETGSVLIAIDNFLLEVGDDEWVDQGCLILSDINRQIQLCSYTQVFSSIGFSFYFSIFWPFLALCSPFD